MDVWQTWCIQLEIFKAAQVKLLQQSCFELIQYNDALWLVTCRETDISGCQDLKTKDQHKISEPGQLIEYSEQVTG